MTDIHTSRIKRAFASSDWVELEISCLSAIKNDKKCLQAHRMLGFSLQRQLKFDEANAAYKKAVRIWPNDAELLINYASVLLEGLKNNEALPILERVCQLRSDHALAWVKLAQCCYELRQHERGYEAAEKALRLSKNVPERVAALNQRAIHRRELGQISEAVIDSEEAIALAPRETANHTNRLLYMLAAPRYTALEVAKAAREFADVFESPLKPYWPDLSHLCSDPWRRLRVGFISPDLRSHSVMYFVEGLLAQLDRRQFEVYGFYLYPVGDSVTDRVKCHVDQFVELKGSNAVDHARAIRDHRIDVLIDLAGHTGHNGLLVLAQKPAPVQVSWLGYPATTGLTAIDYKFTDEVTDPPGADDQYSERLYRLPTLFCCYRPLIRYPIWRYQPRYQVRPAPVLQNGFVTFGSCNNLGKLTDSVLALWGRILQAVPGSRLLLEGKNLDKPAFAEAYRQRCEGLGIDTTRLELVPLDTGNQYLTYHRIDIALDPYPLTGGTTTFDVLWMGVPLVSMEGDSFKSRLSTGILSYLGHTDWLARNADEYVQIACQLAADPQQLNANRLAQRRIVEQSVLMDEPRFAHHFGEGLRLMWLQRVAQAQCPDDPQAQSRLIESWLPSLPVEWSEPLVPGVGISPGVRIALPDAHQRLEALLRAAKDSEPAHHNGPMIKIENPRWQQVTEFAEKILDAVPNDPVALTCLAEVELAHGHTEFAVTYLKYAQDAMAANIA